MNKKSKESDGTGCLISGILFGLFLIWMGLALPAKRDSYLSSDGSGLLVLMGGLLLIGSSIFLMLILSDKRKQARLSTSNPADSKQDSASSTPSHSPLTQIPRTANIGRAEPLPRDASSPRFLVFDLETAKVLPEGTTDLQAYHPLGIACAATLDETGRLQLWHGKDSLGKPTARMTKAEAGSLLNFLREQQASGRYVVTWNGAAFDFHVLGEEADSLDDSAQLARNHADLMFAFVGVKGYRLALKTAAEACGSHKGSAGIESGGEVPKLWAKGEYARCLEYVKQDVQAIAHVTRHLLTNKGFVWRSQRGNSQNFGLPPQVRGLSDMTVAKVLGWPKPDTSWMSDAPRREDFLAWTEGFGEKKTRNSMSTHELTESAVSLAGIEATEPDFTREEVIALIASGDEIDLSWANLAGLDLSGLNFGNANFEGANLTETDLTGADLSGANLRYADLVNASLSNTKLCGANLSDADLSEAFLGGTDLENAILQQVNLTRAKIGYAHLRKANLQGAVLREAVIFTTDLEEADLENAILEDADLTDVWLKRANLRGTCLNGNHLHDVDFDGADLSDCSLAETAWMSCNLQGADLSRVNLRNAHFDMLCNFNDANLEQAQMQHVTIDTASMRCINLSAADLADCILHSVTLTEAVMVDTCLKRAKLILCNMEGANLSGADLNSAGLLGVCLNGTNLRGAVLLNVDLTGISLSGAVYDHKTQWPVGFVPPHSIQ
jgi:uncharacterized protein YjbI with pentapeptide repeats